MPNGYRKHWKGESKHKQRGGSSRHSPKQNTRSFDRPGPEWRDGLAAAVKEEFHDDLFNDKTSIWSNSWHLETEEDLYSEDKKTMKEEVKNDGECAVCLETKPLVSLMKRCRRHPLVCAGCLRETYVVQAQKDVSNYPLKCYHPSCNRIVTTELLVGKGIFKNEEEINKHYRLCELAKSYRGTFQVVHCPSCDHPKHYTSGGTAKCRACRTTFYVARHDFKFSTTETTIRAIEMLDHDEKGRNDGWARCPSCDMIISKGDGCDHIACPCGQHFYFSEWQLGNKAEHSEVIVQTLHSAM